MNLVQMTTTTELQKMWQKGPLIGLDLEAATQNVALRSTVIGYGG